MDAGGTETTITVVMMTMIIIIITMMTAIERDVVEGSKSSLISLERNKAIRTRQITPHYDIGTTFKIIMPF